MRGSAPRYGTLSFWDALEYFWLAGSFLTILLFEFRRAIAAEQRYNSLKQAHPQARAYGGVAHYDLSRRIFDEFYACDAPIADTVEVAGGYVDRH